MAIPSPSPPLLLYDRLQERIENIDIEIRRLEALLSPDEIEARRAEIRAAIRDEQARTANLQASLEAERHISSSEELHERLLVEQESQIWDQQAHYLTERIRQQEARVTQAMRSLHLVLAPPGSPEFLRIQTQLFREQEILEELHREHENLITARSIAAQQRNSERAQRIQSQQARIANIHRQLEIAQQELEQQNRRMRQEDERQQELRNQVEQLRNERLALEQQMAGLRTDGMQ